MEKYSFYYYEDALYLAKKIQPDGGRVVGGSADCSAFDCPRELDSWSGETACLIVQNEEWADVAQIAYWTDVESERDFLSEYIGCYGVESRFGRSILESQEDFFCEVERLKQLGLDDLDIYIFDPSEPPRRFFTDDSILDDLLDEE